MEFYPFKSIVKKYYLPVTLVVMLVIFISLISHINNLNNEIEQYQNEISEYIDELEHKQNQILALNDSFNYLSVEKSNLEYNFDELDEEYSELQDETNSLLIDINTYQEEIEASLEWYKDNSILDGSSAQSRVKRQIRKNCVEIENNQCNINLGCFYLINSENLDLEYQYDSSVYQKEDKLSSIDQFIENEGGDCEDYSLFFKAQYNYAVSECEGNQIYLESWKIPSYDDDVSKYWLNYQHTWYLEDVASLEIADYIHPNIICGNLYDPISGVINGHCMVAYSRYKINSVNDLSYLEGAYIIEPQDGSFQGNINNQNSGVYLLDEDIWYYEIDSYISSVITDNDYYLFDQQELEWNSYSSFNQELTEKKGDLTSLLNE